MSKIIKKSPDKPYKITRNHQKYLKRITKTLYYGKLPKTDTLSLPVTELTTELFSEAHRGKSLERLHFSDAARISRNACVPPCSLMLALLYLERLKTCNPEYVEKTAPSDLFLVSLMISSKFLFDDGESEEVFIDEWAASGGISIKDLIRLEKNFLNAIDWKIFVNEPTFWRKLKDFETTLASREGGLRGYYTYTELYNLITTIELQHLIQCITAVSVILVATYTAGILTLVGSVFLASQVPGTSLYAGKAELVEFAQLEVKTKNDIICNSSEPEYEKLKTDVNSKCTTIRSLGIADMLKTSIFLASIKANSTDDSEKGNDNAQRISWDYWNVPAMKWLAEKCQFVASYAVELPSDYFANYLETSLCNMRYIELEDQIHKATKTRIQDQMESSWHEEWTGTSSFGARFSRILPYLLEVKS